MAQITPVFSYEDSKHFSRLWQGGKTDKDTVTPENLLSGELKYEKGTLGSPQSRQDELSGLVINSAIMTTVYERLKAGDSFDVLQADGLFYSREETHLSLEDWNYIVPDIEVAQKKGDEDEIFKAVCNLSTLGVLKYHRDMVSNDRWNLFSQMRSEGEDVTDPRIGEASPIIEKYFTLTSSGEKTAASIERKIAKLEEEAKEEGGEFDLAAKFRDSVRIRLGAISPEVADDFFMFLKHRQSDKEVDDTLYPRIYREDWDVKPHGLFDCTSYIAMDRLHHPETLGNGGDMAYEGENGKYYLKGVNGVAAEVRMLPYNMEKVEDITHAVFSVQRRLQKLVKHAAGTVEQDEIDALNTSYDKQKNKFIAEEAKLEHFSYIFPERPNVTADSTQSEFAACANKFITLNSTIFKDELMSERTTPDWKREIVKASILANGETKLPIETLEALVPDIGTRSAIIEEVISTSTSDIQR